MPTLVPFDDFAEQSALGVHNFGTDSFLVALTNTAPNAAADDELVDITQIAAGNGYTTGGFAVANVTVSETAGDATISADDLVIAASGGTMATWRYLVLYNGTSTGDKLVGYFDAGEAISLADGASRTLQLSSGFLIGSV